MFKKLIITILLLGFGYTYAQNLVTNGSFSAAAANWNFFAPGITTEAYNPETSYGGTVGTNTVAEIDNQANLRQTNITVTPGTEYGLSFRHTRRTGNGAAPNPSVFIIRVYDANNVYVNQTITSNNPTWNWQCKYFTFTPTGNTVSVDLENVTATTLGTIVDDITIAPTIQAVTINGLTCQGGTVQLQAPIFPGNPDAVYTNHTWTGPNGFTATGSTITLTNLQANNAGNYICTMTLNGCQTVTAIYNLTVSPNSFTRDIAICQGETYDFYGTILSSAGTYDKLVSGGGTQCDSFITLNLRVLPLPNANIIPEPEINICAGDYAEMRVASPSSGATYQWYRNNENIPGSTFETIRTNISGRYNVIANLEGCEQISNTVTLNVLPNPSAQISAPNEILCTMDTVRLSVANPNSNYTYFWEPRTSFSRTGGNENSTVYGIFDYLKNKVSLTAYNEFGCRSKDSIIVETMSCCDMMLPNAFTPNGDGLNDYFKPHLDVGQYVLTFEIYDRYGSVIFGNYVGNPTMGWNGNYKNGKKADNGVYMYFLKYHCSDGKIYTKKGDITLYR